MRYDSASEELVERVRGVRGSVIEGMNGVKDI